MTTTSGALGNRSATTDGATAGAPVVTLPDEHALLLEQVAVRAEAVLMAIAED